MQSEESTECDSDRMLEVEAEFFRSFVMEFTYRLRRDASGESWFLIVRWGFNDWEKGVGYQVVNPRLAGGLFRIFSELECFFWNEGLCYRQP